MHPTATRLVVRRAAFVAGAAILVAAAAPVRLAPGMTFTMRSSGTDANGAKNESSDLHVRYLDGAVRFDVPSDARDDSKKTYGEDAYVVLSRTDRRALIVMPPRKKYIEIGFSSFDSAGVAFQALGSERRAKDVKVSGTSLGSGGVVNGYPTRHFRITTDYTMLPDHEDGKEEKVHSVEEFWVADALADVPDPTEAIARFFGRASGPMAGGEGSLNDLMRQRADAQARLWKGLPVRSSYTSSTTVDGKTTTESGQTDIMDVKKTDLPASDFQIPAGFEKANFKGMAMDAAKEGAKESAKESAKENVKKKLGGLFKRP